MRARCASPCETLISGEGTWITPGGTDTVGRTLLGLWCWRMCRRPAPFIGAGRCGRQNFVRAPGPSCGVHWWERGGAAGECPRCRPLALRELESSARQAAVCSPRLYRRAFAGLAGARQFRSTRYFSWMLRPPLRTSSGGENSMDRTCG